MEHESQLSEQESRKLQLQFAISELQDKLRTQAHNQETEDLKEEFEAIYEKLPEIADLIVHSYQSILAKYHREPGEIRLLMVGGRVKGKPLNKNSDIDLLFETETKDNAEQIHFEKFQNALDAQEERMAIKEELTAALKEICHTNNIKNHFHLLGFGRQIVAAEEAEKNSLELSRLEKENLE